MINKFEVKDLCHGTLKRHAKRITHGKGVGYDPQGVQGPGLYFTNDSDHAFDAYAMCKANNDPTRTMLLHANVTLGLGSRSDYHPSQPSSLPTYYVVSDMTCVKITGAEVVHPKEEKMKLKAGKTYYIRDTYEFHFLDKENEMKWKSKRTDVPEWREGRRCSDVGPDCGLKIRWKLEGGSHGKFWIRNHYGGYLTGHDTKRVYISWNDKKYEAQRTLERADEGVNNLYIKNAGLKKKFLNSKGMRLCKWEQESEKSALRWNFIYE
jgi:hypothetical protein